MSAAHSKGFVSAPMDIGASQLIMKDVVAVCNSANTLLEKVIRTIESADFRSGELVDHE
ncbi:hypothetical protein [Mycobacterium sp.]|uniref:hypothetical protein n=1 Tax=Mycobacterium sp. TaxID=1785 RepID=UPI0025FCA896|nr:hypothetical protein [Mycobacterium sp.]